MKNGNTRRAVPAEAASAKLVRCAIYTRKSTDEGLQQDFNSLDAQPEAAEAFIASQRSEGWQLVPERFDDGGFTGGNMDRAALQRLLTALEGRRVNCVVVYKVDRLSRSLLDFARMMELFDRKGASFVSVIELMGPPPAEVQMRFYNPDVEQPWIKKSKHPPAKPGELPDWGSGDDPG